MISNRGANIPASPIRKLIPFAEKAKASGVKVYHLNIGQPDIHTPPQFWQAIQTCGERVLAYAPSDGLPGMKKVMADYYRSFSADIQPQDVFVTTGGSEAILFTYLVTGDTESEYLVPEPCYANYISIGAMAQIRLVPIPTRVEDGFHLPEESAIEKLVTPRTRGIIVCTPNNPTGTVYSPEELKRVAAVADRHDLFLISDEVYREFLFDGRKHTSILNLPGNLKNRIVLDSVSKRFSACGARVGSIVTKNQDVMKAVMRCAMARLSPPTLGQIGASALYGIIDQIIPDMMKEFERRRNIVHEAITNIPGAFATLPEGAFYITCRLPIPNVEDFCQWMLTDFRIDNKTTMIAPAEGFYISPGKGKDEARIAYVLNETELREAMNILREGVRAYRAR